MRRLKRFGVVLCVLALLCQCMVFPVSAESKTETTGAESAPSGGTLIEGTFDWYVDKLPTDYATKPIKVDASAANKLTGGVSKKKDGLFWAREDGSAQWQVTAPESAWYTVFLTYSGVDVEGGTSSDIELGLRVNGKYPYTEAERFVLPRIWVNDGPVREDTKGNQFAPEQKELYQAQKYPMRDVNGFVADDLRIYLKKGANTLSLETFGEAFMLYSLHLEVPVVLPTLEEKLQQWKDEGISYYTDTELVVEGESNESKSDRSIIGQSDNSNPGVRPPDGEADAFVQKVNYIGGSNWSMSDESITWKVKAPEAGIYKLGVHFRQNYLVNATSYRSLKVNGEHQYAEQQSLAFYYKNSWQFNDKLLSDDRTVLVYLDKGENEITLSVTLGELGSFSAQMEDLTRRLGETYRAIIAIIGENPDANRDYNLFNRIPDLEQNLMGMHDEIEAMIDSRRTEDGDIDDIAALLKKMNVVLDKMTVKGYEAQKYKSNYYDCYSSLSAQLQDMKNMALDIDCMVFAAPESDFERTTCTWGEKFGYDVERFIASFLLDYNTAGGVGGDEVTDLTLWVNWSRDQTLVLNSLINGHFSAENPDVSVTVRMTNASLLQGIMSGNGPDCSLSDARVTPINMAMRGALVDLSKYDDYEEVSSWFVEGADVPYRYEGGVYGLPSTQQFYMLFYRTDIFESYGLEVPKTWDEFLEVASILMLNNMQVGLPFVELKDISLTNGGVAALNIFPTLLLQNDLSLYNEEMDGTSFNEVETMRVFEQWTDYYTKYNLPKEYNFFNRFRIGLVPMAIQSYGQYSALSAAAPEIKGRWAMAEIPGTLREDGTIDNTQAGFGNACMILKLAEERGTDEAAWKLLKWWMREDTQHRYALDIESILGVAGRYTSANVNATLKLDWGRDASGTLYDQWNKVEEIAEIPGGYYVSRAVDQAFWNVVNMNENPKDMMKKWGEIADAEITFKIDQYKDEEKEGDAE
ncbi:MAG: extracellular solute-binding protein [Clostridia bacterium]|nr:extracellular solute-binding protein [Clostridia bacterium]